MSRSTGMCESDPRPSTYHNPVARIQYNWLLCIDFFGNPSRNYLLLLAL